MWSPLAPPSRLTLINGEKYALRRFHHELVHDALRQSDGVVLWCDGDHGFNPYDFAEWNLEHGYEADWGAGRVLVKRCMTPFQWDTVLTKHVDQKLLSVDACMVLAAPFGALFSTDELQDWEQEDYVRYSLHHLRDLARRRRVPIVLSVDMAKWWRTHPVLAQLAFEIVDARWSVEFVHDRWRAIQDTTKRVVDPYLHRRVTLLDFAEEEALAAVRVPKQGSRIEAKPLLKTA